MHGVCPITLLKMGFQIIPTKNANKFQIIAKTFLGLTNQILV